MYESCLLFENETVMYETKVVFEKVGEQNILQSLKLNVSFSKCYPVKQAFVNLFFFSFFVI